MTNIYVYISRYGERDIYKKRKRESERTKKIGRKINKVNIEERFRRRNLYLNKLICPNNFLFVRFILTMSQSYFA